MSVNNFRQLMRKAVESEWAVAYRKKSSEKIIDAKKQNFSLIKNTPRYWCADPFPVEDGTKTYIFFEVFDRIKRKGVIGYREINNNRAGKINIVIEEPFHLSYPYIYCENGYWYIIPESKETNQIIRYYSTKFPERWERETVLIDHISVVDTTLFSFCKDHLKLFTYSFESFNKGTLQVIRLMDHSQSTVCIIEDPDGRKRPAGKICRIGNCNYRPSQLCTRTYGEAIIFNKILSFTDDSYEETEYKILTIKDICLDKTVKISGVHTYNGSENWEVIDVEISGFSILRIIGLLPRLYHRIKRFLKGDAR